MPKSKPSPLPGHGPEDGEVELGFISGVFGVRGEVRLHLHNRQSVMLDGPTNLVLVSPNGERFSACITSRPGAGIRILGRIEGLNDRDEALALKDYKLFIPEGRLPPPSEGEFYVREVEGLPVFLGGEPVGKVLHVHNTPGGDLLEISLAKGSTFVPIKERWVLSIDVQAGRVELAPGALAEE